MWVALLNLENMYGTEESLQKVFERAVQYCEPIPVYQQLADIYTKSNKIKVRFYCRDFLSQRRFRSRIELKDVTFTERDCRKPSTFIRTW